MSNKSALNRREVQALFDHRRVLDKMHLQFIKGEPHKIKLISTIVAKKREINDSSTEEIPEDVFNNSKNFGDTFNSLVKAPKTPTPRIKKQYKKLPISTNYKKYRQYTGRLSLIGRSIRGKSLIFDRMRTPKTENKKQFLIIRNSIG